MTEHQFGAASFFEEWLPRRFAELKAADAQMATTECSLVVQVGGSAWTLTLGGGELSVTGWVAAELDRAGLPSSATFRLHATQASFDLLVAGALEHGAGTNPAIKVLRVDAETARLAGAVPACLRLRVVDGDLEHELIFGPGNQPKTHVGCSVECELADLKAVQRGECDPMELFMSGRLRLEGDLQVAFALGGILL
ncbi:MAG: sterol transfer family [Pseudomonadota bacterium]|jgi:hypothetical protein